MPSGLIKVTVDGKLVRKGLQDLTKEIPEIGRNQIYSVMTRSKTRMKKPVPRPTYPIAWSSLRQKLKVLIMLKGQLPYRRTHAFQKGFIIGKLKNGYTLENQAEQTTYLVGDAEGVGQIPMARGRYPIMREVIDEELDKLPTAVVAHIKLVAAEKGFSTGGTKR